MDEVQPWVDRIFRKVERNLDDIVQWEEDGIDDARVVVVSYGSTARSARQAIKIARARYGRKVGLLRLKTLWPFPESEMERIGDQVLVVGQVAAHGREHDAVAKLQRADARG